MGQEVARLVPDHMKQVINNNKELFEIGLHGPDILFYYKPLSTNKVNATGYGMHDHSGREFFEHAACVLKEKEYEPSYLAYVYGFICHFALDTTCHGYIGEKIAASGVSHAEIEVEFDRELMIKDGFNPISHKLTNHIEPSVCNAEVIFPFFEDIDSSQVQQALQGMISTNNFLLVPSKWKRLLVQTLLHASGNYEEMHGLMVNVTKNPQCNDSTEKLLQLYEVARDRAVKMIYEYGEFLSGKMQLDTIYNLTFAGEMGNREEQHNEYEADEARKELGIV
jgi:hypothetical protein